MKTYNKLVRDKIPQIIESNGSHPKTKVLSNDEYIKALNQKLLEEAQEFVEAQNIEELADIMEVIDAICKFKDFSMQDILAEKNRKFDSRGGFEKKIFLEDVEG